MSQIHRRHMRTGLIFKHSEADIEFWLWFIGFSLIKGYTELRRPALYQIALTCQHENHIGRSLCLHIRTMISAQRFKWIITHQIGFCVTLWQHWSGSAWEGVGTGTHWDEHKLIFRSCELVNQTLLANRFDVLVLVPVPDRPISTNPGLKILFHLLYLSSHALLRVTVYMYVYHQWILE